MIHLIAASQFLSSWATSPIVDSEMTRSAAMGSSKAPKNVVARQSVVRVLYFGFDHRLHQGQLVVDRSLANDVAAIFNEIRGSKFPVARVIPVRRFGWSDMKSMAHNNTSGFNYRRIFGSHGLSAHAAGRAIDINPIQNPDMHLIGVVGGRYRPGRPGTITLTSPVYRAFKRRGWKWGGLWRGKKDYQHFYKP